MLWSFGCLPSWYAPDRRQLDDFVVSIPAAYSLVLQERCAGVMCRSWNGLCDFSITIISTKQSLTCAVLGQAIELKFKAPTAHTFLEVIKVRWGFWAHKVFYFVGIATNLLVSINMLQGAVVVTNALTGINIYGEGLAWMFLLDHVHPIDSQPPCMKLAC